MKSSDELIRELLEKRGIKPEDFEKFLNPDIRDLKPAEELDGVIEAAETILSAIAEKRMIVVFGDYDCDGVCATAILVRTLSVLNAKVEAFIPKRLEEGYGMSETAIARMLGEFPDCSMVITVDNGINAVQEVAGLKVHGIKVVITDHHLPGNTLPEADAMIDPKVAAPAELQEICGATVAFLLAERLITEAKNRGWYNGESIGGPLLVLAGLATVTDIMPLLGQNRILVSEALKRFPRCAPLGLKELHNRAARGGYDQLTSKDFGFLLGPRINAAGRISSGMAALELILTEDREISRESARIIDTYNYERKSIESGMTEEALQKVVPEATAQVIDLPNGHPGVAGIVAARVLERMQVPVCVVAGGHGSARAPEGVNIRDAFVACDEYLERYGGHAAAGGFSVRAGKMDEFRKALCEYCRGLPKVSAKDSVDVKVELEDITLELAEQISKLEPFGEGNREPVLAFEGVYLSEVRTLGQDGKHLQFGFSGSSLRAIWWGHGDEVEALRKLVSPVTVNFALIISEYGERHVELRVISVEPFIKEGDIKS